MANVTGRISFAELLSVAMDSVWAHRFRSLLTVLGIVIGITTVVTVSSLLTGLRQGITTFFSEFGPDNVFISRYSGDPNQPPQVSELRRRNVGPETADLIRRLIPNVEEVSMILYLPGFIGKSPITAKVPGFESDQVNMVGMTASGFLTQPRNFLAGRPYTEEEDRRGARVCVIGPKLAEALFPSGGAVGQPVIVAGAEYTIVGVTEEAKGGFFGENPLDRQVTIPFSVARLRYPGIDRFVVIAKAREGRRNDVEEETRQILRRFRKVPAGAPDDFSLTTADQIIARFDSITTMIVMVSIAISGLGLLVGGIGVMNIMLVSVTERTKEIGIRKALGARRGDIIVQFLSEAIALTGAGGLLGIAIAIVVTMIVGKLMPSLPSVVPPTALIVGFSVSVGIGIFFGTWPAVKASRLDPVEALRYE
ncbi:MAG TPA: ABC transporter permease [Bryobacteraceae bacterium]|nr:ABC transporter permease [Bryobacteraceae bacterium]